MTNEEIDRVGRINRLANGAGDAADQVWAVTEMLTYTHEARRLRKLVKNIAELHGKFMSDSPDLRENMCSYLRRHGFDDVLVEKVMNS